jgi:trk system potassium uptake protein TrkA
MRVLIVGGGKPVYFLGRRFAGNGHTATIVCDDRGECEKLARRVKATVIFGNGTDPRVLEQAGCAGADALIAVASRDQDNLITCQLASRHFGVARVVALVDDPDNEAVFERLGVAAFSSTPVIARMLEQRISAEALANLVSAAGGRVSVNEARVAAGSPAAGRAVRDLRFPPDCLVGVVAREDDVLIPTGSTVLEAGDTVILISRPEHSGALARMFDGEQA